MTMNNAYRNTIFCQNIRILTFYSYLCPAMTDCEQYIIEYASKKDTFRAADLLVDATDGGFTDTTVNWTLRKLTAEGKLFRTGRGVYSVRGKQEFRNEPDENLIKLAKEINEKYPSVKTCFYKGTILSPLLHHLAYNALTYIEVPRELTEILFHRLKETSDKVWLKPSREVMQNYIDLSQPGIIIKPIISDSPITVESGIPMPTLEKLLVDTLCDDGFNYLQGGEWQYMIENAYSLFTVNQSRLLRYAGRRGKLQEISTAIKPYIL